MSQARITEPAESSEFYSPGDIAPHLKDLMERYAATGLPPAYIPHSPRAELAETETGPTSQQLSSNESNNTFIEQDIES